MGPDSSRRWPGELAVIRLLTVNARDEAAAELLAQVGPEILGFLRRVLPCETDAADAWSAFAEDVWRGLPGWRAESSLRAWTYRVAHHAAARVLRDPWRRRRESLACDGDDLSAPEPDGDEPTTEHDERASALAEMRLALSPGDDELLEWRGVRGVPWSTIAAFRSWKGNPAAEAALRKRFQRIKARLAREARARGSRGDRGKGGS